MTNDNDIAKQLQNVLKDCVGSLPFDDYSLHIESSIGNGFMGEFFKVTLQDKGSGKKYHIVAKRAPAKAAHRRSQCADVVYKNEIHFYETIVPNLRRYEKIDCFAKYVCSDKVVGRETVVLEDITVDGFAMRDKTLLLDEDHLELIFATYGKFHAISMCWKEDRPEEFVRCTKAISQVLPQLIDQPIGQIMCSVAKESGLCLDPIKDAEILVQYRKYMDDCRNLLLTKVAYKGQHSAVLHGDCWSNNMMFKYDSNDKPTAMKLLDFQMTKVGSPIDDLSYFFYTGAEIAHLDKLEYYLDVYHKQFAQTVSKLGFQPDKIMPRRILTEEWKLYSKLGMLQALMLARVKLVYPQDIVKYIKAMADMNPEHRKDAFMRLKYDEEAFAMRVRGIIGHMYETGSL